MRRRLLGLFAGVLLVSCSDDSSPARSQHPPAPKRISSSLTWSQPVAGVDNLDRRRTAGTAGQAPEAEAPEVEEFVVSGTVRNETGADLTGAKVVAWWGVVTGEDYNYLFGEGTVDVEDLTFELVLSEAPPIEALNGNLGVAYLLIVKTSGTGMEEPGILPDDYDFGNILGAAPRHCVIFSTGENSSGIPWVVDFEPGYSAGIGIEIPDYGFEGFEPVDPSSVEIVVDDLENLVFVNWT